MNRQQFQREKEYGAALAIAKAMLNKSLITANDYRRLRAALMRKYRPVIGSLQNNPTRIG